MPKRIAIVTTIWKYLSHAQHMGDRFLIGYPFNGRWHKPDIKVVSLYVDQKPAGDQSQERAKEFGFSVYPTISETLRCGGDKLAVDAVVIIGEHGDYAHNELGQILYPRHEFFKQCVEVFEKDGRAVPVYNDKHLSCNLELCALGRGRRRVDWPAGAGAHPIDQIRNPRIGKFRLLQRHLQPLVLMVHGLDQQALFGIAGHHGRSKIAAL